jgi:carboxyl-terminal processing protease
MFVKNLYKTLLCSATLLLVFSCEKALIKPDPTSDAERNFEIFWNDVNNGYPYFVEDGINWKDKYDLFRPQVKSSTSTSQLFGIMTSMTRQFSDMHLGISYLNSYAYNASAGKNSVELVRADANGSIVSSVDPLYYYLDNYLRICKDYIDPFTYQEVKASNGVNADPASVVCMYGLLKGTDIIYINITSFLTQYDLNGLLQDIFRTYPSAKGLVLDLRMNGGGNLGTMWDAMSVFMPNNVSVIKYGYNREKVGPLPENFGPEKIFAIENYAAQTKFLKPIVVLANRGTVSAAEHATMAMREIGKYNRKIRIVGDKTFGATSFIVQRTLPCGIQYTLINSKTWDINRQIVERVGVKPDETVYLLENKVMANQDNQLERAIEIIDNGSF